jgi:hypothetical protein
VYYANLADTATITISKKGIDFKAVTITDGETTYEQSGIAPTATADQTAFDDQFTYDDILFELTDASAEKTYDLYLDNYGYVRAFTLNKYTYGMGLLTNAYYYTDGRNDNAAKVEMVVNPDTDKNDYEVSTAGRDWNIANFIITTTDAEGNRGTWGRLNTFTDTKAKSAHTFATNVAAYADNDGVLTLAAVSDYTNKTRTTVQEELDLANVTSLSNRKYASTARTSGSASEIYATTDTVYYYVSGNNVYTWTGYANAPARLTLDGTQDYAYAVATRVATSTSYYTADVIVIEAKSAAKALNFVYFANTIGNAGATDKNTTSYWLNTIALDDEGEVDPATYVDIAKGGVLDEDPDFYTISGQTITPVTAYTANGIYAAQNTVGANVSKRDYVYLDDTTSFRIGEGYTPVYKLTTNNAKNAWVAYGIEECTSVEIGAQLIYVKSGNTVLYAINVTESVDVLGATLGKLNTLYATIKDDNDAYGKETPSVTFFGQNFDPSSNTISASVSYATYLAHKDDATVLTVNNGKFVITDGPSKTTLLSTIAGQSGSAYTSGTYNILGNDGKYYTLTLNVQAQGTVQGRLVSSEPTVVPVVTLANGTQNVVLKSGTKETLTIAGLKQILSASKTGESVEIIAKDAAGKDITETYGDDEPLSTAKTLTINLVSADGKKSPVTIVASGTTYVLTLQGDVKAYTDSSYTYEVLSGEAVLSTVGLYFRADSTGTITRESGTALTTASDNTTTAGKTTAAISALNANTTIKFTAETKLDQAAAILTASAMNVIVKTEDGTVNTALKAKIASAVEAKLSSLSGVTATVKSVGSLGTASANGTATASDLVVTLTDTNETPNTTKDVTVKLVTVECTYTEDDLIAAINASIAGDAAQYSVGGSAATAEGLKGLIKTAIEKVKDVTSADNNTAVIVKLADISVVSQSGKMEQGAVVDVTYTVTYNGDEYPGSTTVTLVS